MTLALARLTFLECARRAFPYVLAGGLLLMVLTSRLFLNFAFGQAHSESLNIVISGVFLAGFLVAAFQGSALIRRDLERGTLGWLLTKPTTPTHYLLGRLLGLSAASLLTGGLVAVGSAACFTLVPMRGAPELGWGETLAAATRAAPPILVLNAAALAISCVASRTAAPLVLLALFLAGSLVGGTAFGFLLPDFGLFSLDANATPPGVSTLLYAVVFSSLFLVGAYIFLALRTQLSRLG